MTPAPKTLVERLIAESEAMSSATLLGQRRNALLREAADALEKAITQDSAIQMVGYIEGWKTRAEAAEARAEKAEAAVQDVLRHNHNWQKDADKKHVRYLEWRSRADKAAIQVKVLAEGLRWYRHEFRSKNCAHGWDECCSACRAISALTAAGIKEGEKDV